MKKRWTRVAALALSALMLLGGCSAPAQSGEATTQLPHKKREGLLVLKAGRAAPVKKRLPWQ